jgi:tRNA wybutosine-synthesizing protein 1
MPQGKWATRIDFERFFDLFEGKAQGTGVDGGWRPEDYVGGETPEWALWGNGGFDPRDQRVYRKGKGPKVEEVEVAQGGDGEGGESKNKALEF